MSETKIIKMNGRSYVLQEDQIVHTWLTRLGRDRHCYIWGVLCRLNRKTYILETSEGVGCPPEYLAEGKLREFVAAGWLSEEYMAEFYKTSGTRQAVTVDQYGKWYVKLSHEEAQEWLKHHQGDDQQIYLGSSVTPKRC